LSLAEERTAELIACIKPNTFSEERRNAVANYVQRLITDNFSCKVFTFGSVPLKTYLPDGDIDLTAFSEDLDFKDSSWATGVQGILDTEQNKESAEFKVKEVQYIQAEVKIIKCLVENIVVDISFNQLGGLCTLCFLEEVDNLISQDHLFKRSIILIKAWCYYESRVLGAHHGLISTYALETLVLYIFHIFNNSFSGPLEVLYRFLDFFSKFDWDRFCVSLWGPVPVSSLPDITVESPRRDTEELLLSRPFLEACSTVYAVFPKTQENQGQPFASKYFNVIDPLRTNNNLGRSVSKGNFFRIRSAFRLGAERLAWVLECPKEFINYEVDKFFTDTWQRHQIGYRPDVPLSFPYESHAMSEDACESMESPQNIVTPIKGDDGAGRMFPNNGPMAYGRKNSSIDQIGRSVSSSRSIQSDKCIKNIKSDRFVIDHAEEARFQFSRTYSSPELAYSSAEHLTSQTPERMTQSMKNQLTYVRVEQSGDIRKNSGAEVTGGYASHHNVGSAVEGNNASNSQHSDISSTISREDHSSLSHTLEMRQEQQDLVNMMSSSRIHNFSRQAPLPMNIPLPPHVLAQTRYPPQNVGQVHAKIHLLEPHWGFNMQLHHVPVNSTLTPYFHSADLDANSEEIVESGSEASYTPETNQKDEAHNFSHAERSLSSHTVSPDNDNRDQIQQSVVERGTISSFLGPVLDERHQFPSHEASQMCSPDPVIPVGPVLVYPDSNQMIGNNQGVGPMRFYQTGPPVLYTIPPVSVDSDGSANQIYHESVQLTSPNHNFDLSDRSEQLGSPVTFHGQNADILNGDFCSHWKNLLFGRLCQQTGFQDQMGYNWLSNPEQSSVHPIYTQAHHLMDGSGRPLPQNANQFPQYRPQVFPVTHLQTRNNNSSDIYTNHGDEAQIFRGGTGSYLPKSVSQ